MKLFTKGADRGSVNVNQTRRKTPPKRGCRACTHKGNETLRACVRLALNSGARADIPGSPLWAIAHEETFHCVPHTGYRRAISFKSLVAQEASFNDTCPRSSPSSCRSALA